MIEVQCDKDDVIISQGEDGDHFYLVDRGTYEVFLSQSGEEPVSSYDSGKSHGELVEKPGVASPPYGPRGGSQGSACSNGPRSTASAASELAAASAARLTRRTRREGDPLVWAPRFGELALLYNSPRAATIKCKDCLLYTSPSPRD